MPKEILIDHISYNTSELFNFKLTKKHTFCVFSSFCGLSEGVSSQSACLTGRAMQRMNDGVLNIKDEEVAQQLFLFIFH